MDEQLIDALWTRALVEGDGVSGTGRLMAQLVAEECAKVCDAKATEVEYGALGSRAEEYDAYLEAAGAIRAKFGLLNT